MLGQTRGRVLKSYRIQVGDVLLQLGRIGEALKEFRKAHDLRAKSGSAAHASVSDRRDLSLSHNRLSLALDLLGLTSQALEEIEKAIVIRETLARQAAEDDSAQRDLDAVRHQQARILAKLNRSAEAKTVLEGILQRCFHRRRREPRNLRFLHDIAITYSILGAVELNEASIEAARACFSEGAASLRELMAHDPSNPTWTGLFASLSLSSADLDLLLGNHDSAAQTCNEICDLLRPLFDAEARPEDEHGILAGAEVILAEIHYLHGEIADARNGFERAVASLEKLANLKALESKVTEKAFHAYGRLGSLLLQDTSQTREAERVIKRAIDIGFQLVKQPTCRSWVEGDLAANLDGLARLLATRGERDEAIRTYLSAATLMDQQLEVRANDSQWLQQLLKLHWDVLVILNPDEFLPDGRSPQDADSRRKEIQFALRALAAGERGAFDSTVLSIILTLLAGVELAVGERDPALRHLKQSLTLRIRSEKKHHYPGVIRDVQRIVALEEIRGDLDSALKALRDGISLFQRDGDERNPMLTGLWSMLGDIHRQRGNREEARAAFAEAYEILFETQGCQDPGTCELLKTVLAFDTLLGNFERGSELCLRYFDVNPEIQRILKPLSLVARDAARVMAARRLVLPSDQLSGNEELQREVLISAEQALLENGTEEANLRDRMQDFLEQDLETFLRAGLAIVTLVLRD